jgi:hypothetical protein
MKGRFVPVGFKPRPFAMFGVPGNPREIMEQIKIDALGDTTNQIEYLKNMIESSVAQTPTRRGIEDGQRTLGEIQLNLSQANKMTSVDMKQYRNSWYEIAVIFTELIDKNFQRTTLEAENIDGELKTKEITYKDIEVSGGYKPFPVYKTDKVGEDNETIQKTQYVINNLQGNPVALSISVRKQLEALGYSVQEIEQIMSTLESNQSARNAQQEEYENIKSIPAEIRNRQERSDGGGLEDIRTTGTVA